MAQDKSRRKAFVVQYPDDWDSLTPEQKRAVAEAMAREARKMADQTKEPQDRS